MKVSARQASVFATLLLHTIPVVLLWLQWQQMRVQSAAFSSKPILEVRLQPSLSAVASLSEKKSDKPEVSEEFDLLAGSDAESRAYQGTSYTAPEIVAEPPPFDPVYLAGAELDVRPQPDKPLTIPFPDANLEQALVTAVLVLYIGVDGSVDSIDVLDSTLPPEFERVAKDAFMKANMLPGLREGKAVRSQMKVLVEFESRRAF